MQSFRDFKYNHPESNIGPETYRRRMRKLKKNAKKLGLSTVTTPEEKDDDGNSRLSSIKKVTSY